MALVEITGKAWEHNRVPVPSNLMPELWFRPVSSNLTAVGLLTHREVKATLATDGGFTVSVESAEGILYVPYMRWLVDASQASEAATNRARNYCEWEPIYPASGGPIGALPGVVRLNAVWYGFGNPPTYLASRRDVIYLDISGTGVGVWAPSEAQFTEGTVI